jgi:L,D-transpeptidase YcbB
MFYTELKTALEQGSVQSGEVFDAALEEALQKFQQRHGLAADGVVGASTLAALNVPVGARIRQIELNMERWRWLPQDLGERYILVNIANFALSK